MDYYLIFLKQENECVVEEDPEGQRETVTQYAVDYLDPSANCVVTFRKVR